ncbi:CHAT domain-containing tetratricopeptide repeat protein [Streptomyces ureilyticus]|uniref:CHAT domain-containing protein n=1 Tax=Streptomyces ureilyticus TaxID=1775131 RepID=A0ABX0E1T2_9ACTN|nr:CHAT domain-containing protein [Streptomyces ureilyticus]NGO48156.1 CHAT domain-containing protein [Streptomyces ureilyticus]
MGGQVRKELLAAVVGLQRIRATGGLPPALEPQALEATRRLAALLRDSSGDLPGWYALGWLCWFRYLALAEGGDGADHDEAVAAFTPCFLAGVDGLPVPLLPRLAEAAAPRAEGMLQQALVSTDPGLLSSVVDLWQRIVRATPADHPSRAGGLGNLGGALSRRFERTGDQADLDEAITAVRGAVQATPADHRNHAGGLYNLGIALKHRFERTGDQADVDEAITAMRDAVQATPADHPDHAWFLGGLGAVLPRRFERTGDQADLDEAITAGRDAVQALPVDHPNRVWLLSNLGAVLQRRFERTGDQADLDEATTAERDAVQAMPVDHPDRARLVTNLGGTLWARFERTGDQADLDEATTAVRDAVQVTPVDLPDRAAYLSNLGITLRARFGRTGNLADLDEAITAGRDAVQAIAVDHPNRAGYLSDLGAALQRRFERTGNQADLDAAITAGRDAVQATPVNHSKHAGRLVNLGVALMRRFEHTGDQADLDQTIDLCHAAVGATPASSPNYTRHLSDLGNALQRRFERTGGQADLDAAITAGRDAVQATPDNHPNRAMYLSNLGNALQRRFERTGGQADLDAAITAGRDAVQATPDNHPNHTRYLSNLGASQLARFERTGNQADLDAVITAGRDAVQATPDNHPDRAMYLSNLGNALQRRFERTGDQADLEAAVSAYTRAWEMDSAAPTFRVRAAWAVAELVAESTPGRAADMAEAAVRLLPEVTPRQLERGDQQHALGDFAGLAGDAAALALADPRGGQPERATRALRLLEAGRAVLLSQALDARSDVTDLNRQHPDLAARFVQLRDQLDQPAGTFDPADGSEDVDELAAQQERAVRDRHRLARDFAKTLADIRALAGFDSFALPPTPGELLAEANQGPVVVFNVSRYRSDALLLTQGGITHLELPQLTVNSLTEQVNAFHRALHTATSGTDKTQRRQAQAVMVQVLQWLWDAAAGPVLEALGHHRQPSADADWPRVWWAPGGLLGLLPLHAAGYHTDPVDEPGRRTVMDRVISSYTPTVRALRHARQHAPVPDKPAQGLVVAMPTTPDLPDQGRLPHVGSEASKLHQHLPELTLLLEPDPSDGGALAATAHTPTKDKVLDHLTSCSIAHFACHGTSHPTDPSKSRLLLHDHASDPLTVASLAPVRLGQAQLAYLSACRTAAIDTANLIDEAIHLTSAFQLAGFPHVVGTLWEIDDQIAVTIADAFYTHLRTPTGTLDTSRAAWALHQAVRDVRDGHDLPGGLDRTQSPFLWAAYLHAGA